MSYGPGSPSKHEWATRSAKTLVQADLRGNGRRASALHFPSLFRRSSPATRPRGRHERISAAAKARVERAEARIAHLSNSPTSRGSLSVLAAPERAIEPFRVAGDPFLQVSGEVLDAKRALAARVGTCGRARVDPGDGPAHVPRLPELVRPQDWNVPAHVAGGLSKFVSVRVPEPGRAFAGERPLDLRAQTLPLCLARSPCLNEGHQGCRPHPRQVRILVTVHAEPEPLTRPARRRLEHLAHLPSPLLAPPDRDGAGRPTHPGHVGWTQGFGENLRGGRSVLGGNRRRLLRLSSRQLTGGRRIWSRHRCAHSDPSRGSGRAGPPGVAAAEPCRERERHPEDHDVGSDPSDSHSRCLLLHSRPTGYPTAQAATTVRQSGSERARELPPFGKAAWCCHLDRAKLVDSRCSSSSSAVPASTT